MGHLPGYPPDRITNVAARRRRTLGQPARRRTLLFEFLAYSGLRIGAALGLAWSDIDFDVSARLEEDGSSERRETPRPAFAPAHLRLAPHRPRVNVVFVSRQLGPANATITLEVYAHLFEQGAPSSAYLSSGHREVGSPRAPSRQAAFAAMARDERPARRRAARTPRLGLQAAQKPQ